VKLTVTTTTSIQTGFQAIQYDGNSILTNGFSSCWSSFTNFVFQFLFWISVLFWVNFCLVLGEKRSENRRKVPSLFSLKIFCICFFSLPHCLTVIFMSKILFGLRETEGKGKKNSQWFSFLNNSPHSVFQSLRPFPFRISQNFY
jgi:hypothetical protein